MNQTITGLLLCAAALALSNHETLAQSPASKAHIKWVIYDDRAEPNRTGKYEDTDKYIIKIVSDDDGRPLAVLFVLPNRQVFSSETTKGAADPPYVNEDETLVAMTCYPATQTGNLHIYIREENGKWRELPNEENGAVNDLLRKAYDNFVGWNLEVRAIGGRTLTVWAIVKGHDIEKDDGVYRFEFKLHVARDGKLALVR
jgi:hypothetical protein